MTVLVTGGTGVIGRRLARLLVERGTRVRLLDTVPDGDAVADLGDAVEVVAGDVTEPDTLGAATTGVSAVVHLAFVLGAESDRDPLLATRVNALGTAVVLEAARRRDVPRVLLASSIAVYGSDSMYDAGQLPLTEDAAPYTAPGLPVYGAGKVYLEALARRSREEHGLLVAGLRPSVVYGVGRTRGATSWMAELVEGPALGRPAAVGLGDAAVSLVSVDDVAEQFLGLLDVPAERFGPPWFVNTGGDRATVAGVAEVVRRLVPGADVTVTSGGERDLYGLATSVSEEAVTRLLGRPRRHAPLEEGLAAYVEATRARARG